MIDRFPSNEKYGTELVQTEQVQLENLDYAGGFDEHPKPYRKKGG